MNASALMLAMAIVLFVLALITFWFARVGAAERALPAGDVMMAATAESK